MRREAGTLMSEPFKTPQSNRESWNPSTLSIDLRTYATGGPSYARPGTVSQINPASWKLLLPAVWLQRHGKLLLAGLNPQYSGP